MYAIQAGSSGLRQIRSNGVSGALGNLVVQVLDRRFLPFHRGVDVAGLGADRGEGVEVVGI